MYFQKLKPQFFKARRIPTNREMNYFLATSHFELQASRVLCTPTKRQIVPEKCNPETHIDMPIQNPLSKSLSARGGKLGGRARKKNAHRRAWRTHKSSSRRRKNQWRKPGHSLSRMYNPPPREHSREGVSTIDWKRERESFSRRARARRKLIRESTSPANKALSLSRSACV